MRLLLMMAIARIILKLQSYCQLKLMKKLKKLSEISLIPIIDYMLRIRDYFITTLQILVSEQFQKILHPMIRVIWRCINIYVN